MQTQSAGAKLTYDDLLALPEDRMRHELIDGEHFVTPAPKFEHQLIVGNIFHLLTGYVREHGLGVVVLAPFDVVLSPHDVVEPDVMYFATARFHQVVGELNAQGPPNLAVEVLSPSTRRRDQTLKRDLYERAGVQEYWLVDPERESVTVYQLHDGSYRQCSDLLLENDAILTSPLVPGLELPLKQVFELPWRRA